eukprot:14011682-Alexandrium_andersonii.AAC.1
MLRTRHAQQAKLALCMKHNGKSRSALQPAQGGLERFLARPGGAATPPDPAALPGGATAPGPHPLAPRVVMIFCRYALGPRATNGPLCGLESANIGGPQSLGELSE